MNSNSCGGGLVVFSLTLIFGILIADQFAQNEEVVVESPFEISEPKILKTGENKLPCVGDYENNQWTEYAFLRIDQFHLEQYQFILKRSELMAKLENLEKYSKLNSISKSEKIQIKRDIIDTTHKLREVTRNFLNLTKKENLTKYGSRTKTRNENLLNSEICHEQQF